MLSSIRTCLEIAYHQGETHHKSMWQFVEVMKDCTSKQACLMKVEDELCKILNGVDVVMRRWGNERHSRLAAAQVSDVGGHLLAGQLASLTCVPGRGLSASSSCSSHVAVTQLSSADPMPQRLPRADGSVWFRFSSMHIHEVVSWSSIHFFQKREYPPFLVKGNPTDIESVNCIRTPTQSALRTWLRIASICRVIGIPTEEESMIVENRPCRLWADAAG